MCIEYYKMAHLPGGIFLTDPYQLCDKNTPCEAEAPGKEIQAAPCTRIRGSNSDDYEQDGKTSGPGIGGEGVKTWDVKKGIPYDAIEAFGRDVVGHVPRREGIMGENWQDRQTVEM